MSATVMRHGQALADQLEADEAALFDFSEARVAEPHGAEEPPSPRLLELLSSRDFRSDAAPSVRPPLKIDVIRTMSATDKIQYVERRDIDIGPNAKAYLPANPDVAWHNFLDSINDVVRLRDGTRENQKFREVVNVLSSRGDGVKIIASLLSCGERAVSGALIATARAPTSSAAGTSSSMA